MKVPNYIRSKMHLCASHARQAAKYEFEVANWLGEHGIDVEFISNGDGASLEELMYGNDVPPVVHARWMPFHSEAAGDIQYCSACEIGFSAKTNFCPNCGAKMDGGKNDVAS